jgi:hypothetical protein
MIKQAMQFFLTEVYLPICLMMAPLNATDDVYIHNQCQQSMFALKNRFYASLIIIKTIETP